MTTAQETNFDNFLAESAQVEFSALAKEQVECEVIRGTIYAYGSELACLRLFKAFKAHRCNVEYSTNLQTWYFSKSK